MIFCSCNSQEGYITRCFAPATRRKVASHDVLLLQLAGRLYHTMFCPCNFRPCWSYLQQAVHKQQTSIIFSFFDSWRVAYARFVVRKQQTSIIFSFCFRPCWSYLQQAVHKQQTSIIFSFFDSWRVAYARFVGDNSNEGGNFALVGVISNKLCVSNKSLSYFLFLIVGKLLTLVSLEITPTKAEYAIFAIGCTGGAVGDCT